MYFQGFLKTSVLRKKNRNFISIVIATVAAGIPISTVSPYQLDFTDPLFLLIWTLPGIICSFGTFLYFNMKMQDIIGTFIMGYMLAVILRFVMDILVNNIVHSYFSISLLTAMAAGGLSGWMGAGLWLLIKRSRR